MTIINKSFKLGESPSDSKYWKNIVMEKIIYLSQEDPNVREFSHILHISAGCLYVSFLRRHISLYDSIYNIKDSHSNSETFICPPYGQLIYNFLVILGMSIDKMIYYTLNNVLSIYLDLDLFISHIFKK